MSVAAALSAAAEHAAEQAQEESRRAYAAMEQRHDSAQRTAEELQGEVARLQATTLARRVRTN